MQTTTRQASIDELLQSGALEAHWREMRGEAAFQPNLGLMRMLSEVGTLRVLVCERGSEILGYVAALVFPSLLDAAEMDMQVVAVWVAKEARHSTSSARELFRAVRDEAKRLGATKLLWGAPVHSTLDHLLCALGKQLVENVYMEAV